MDRATIRAIIIKAIEDDFWPPDDPELRDDPYSDARFIDNPRSDNPAPRFDGDLPLDAIAEALLNYLK